MHRPAGTLPRLDAAELRGILLLWAAWSAAVLLLAALFERLPPVAAGPWGASMPAPPLARWDSGWYASIARDGYGYDAAQPQNNIGFVSTDD